jgi:putative component of membrane protein insertase Oxa1/YidC/SpoIIIJ protein YidD
MLEAIKEWGVLKGFVIGMKRVFRCHPWGDHGFDPVPKRNDKTKEDTTENNK